MSDATTPGVGCFEQQSGAAMIDDRPYLERSHSAKEASRPWWLKPATARRAIWEVHMASASRSMVVVGALAILTVGATSANALDTVLCVKATGNGAPKFRAAKPPAAALCKPTEIQIAHFDGATLQFSGLDVQIVSGSGATDGPANGKGNLIVGYNERLCSLSFGTDESSPTCSGDSDCTPNVCSSGFCQQSGDTCTTTSDCPPNLCGQRTGSHNLVVGRGHNYTSYGGFVAGRHNSVSGPYASVSGGVLNSATEDSCTVSGGAGNVAGSGPFPSYGVGNSIKFATVAGGIFNRANKQGAVVSGGFSNTASGFDSSVSGGSSNTAQGDWASVSGGRCNVAGFGSTSVRDCTDIEGGDSVSGGTSNFAAANGASISGGLLNRATGRTAAVSGGHSNTATGPEASVSGGYLNAASSNNASVSGGRQNTASGDGSSVSGGLGNVAGPGAPPFPGFFAGVAPSVSGGYRNQASGAAAAVTAGGTNTATGDTSTVSGGHLRSATGTDDWVAGGFFQDN